MVNRNKTKSLSPGQAGCGGRGVLNAPRKFGGNSKSETQKTFETNETNSTRPRKSHSKLYARPRHSSV